MNYFVCIDVDCVLEQDALLKLANHFLENSTQRVIAAGGVVRIANGCEIEGGRLVKVNYLSNFCPGYKQLNISGPFCLPAWPGQS